MAAGNALSSGPATDALAANLSDSVNLTNGPCRSLYIGVAGDVKVTLVSGAAVTFTAVPVGILPIACLRVWSTGTAASSIVALY